MKMRNDSGMDTPIGSLDASDEKSRITLRRLMLAKQMFLHGIEHSNETDALSKMIAIHNLHNAVEITLRSIFLHFDIRPEKELNIGFENMLKDVEKHADFKSRNIKLPYRQEMRNLNQIRNLVQHQAVEPTPSSIEESRVFVRRFLKKTYLTFWGCDFDGLTPIEMITDRTLRELLSLSLVEMEANQFGKALTLTEAAFHWASRAILDFLPVSSYSPDSFPTEFSALEDFSRNLNERLAARNEDSIRFGMSRFGEGFKELDQFAEQLSGSLRAVERRATYYAALLNSGIQLVDYKRFKECTPVSYFINASGQGSVSERRIGVHWKGMDPDENHARWAHSFAVNSIIHWQTTGLNPCIVDGSHAAVFAEILLKWDDGVSVHN